MCTYIISPPNDRLYILFDVLPLSSHKTMHVKVNLSPLYISEHILDKIQPQKVDCMQEVEIDFSITTEKLGKFYRLFMKRIYLKDTMTNIHARDSS